MSDVNKGLELKTVIEQLRKELGELAETAGGEKIQFALDSVEVELNVVVTKGGEVGAKAGFWVFTEASATGSYSKEQTQTIKLTLKPRRRGSKDGEVLVSSDD